MSLVSTIQAPATVRFHVHNDPKIFISFLLKDKFNAFEVTCLELLNLLSESSVITAKLICVIILASGVVIISSDNVWNEMTPGDTLGVDWRMRLAPAPGHAA